MSRQGAQIIPNSTQADTSCIRIQQTRHDRSPCPLLLQFHKQLKQLVSRAATHPKMAALLEVVLQHFKPEGPTEPQRAVGRDMLQLEDGPIPLAAAAPEGGAGDHDQPAAGRVIIFTNRRDSVQSIVEMLRAHEPLITARYGRSPPGGHCSRPQEADSHVCLDGICPRHTQLPDIVEWSLLPH